MFSTNRIKYIHFIGLVIIVIGCLNLVGWQLDITVLKSFSSEMTSMNPLTALTFIASGFWLYFFKENNLNRKSVFLEIFILLIGLLHSLAYQFSLEFLRLDHLLFTAKVDASFINSHLAPTTAVLFMLSGIIMLSSHAQKKWVLILRQLLSIMVFATAYSSILGYLYGRDSAYRVEGISTIALSTALVFLLLSMSLFLCNIMHGMPKLFASILEGSALLRRVSFFMLVFPPFLGYLRIVGEKKGLYSTEMGIELHTIIFTLVIFILVYFYASLLNNKQQSSIILEHQLAESEKKFKKLVASLREGVASIDYNGKVVYCNPSYCTILGYSEEELVGSVVVEMIIPLEKRAIFLERLKNRKQGIQEDYQTEVIRKDGEKIIIDIKSNALFNEQGSSDSYVVSFTDFRVEIRNIEDIIAFSCIAAHDLNSPINKILTIVDLVDPDSLNEENKEFLQMVRTTIVSMKTLTQDLLAFSRLGTQALEKSSVNINEIVQDICKQQLPPNFTGQLSIQKLPDAKANEGAVKQLFNNLISNAFKYSSKKTVPEIEIGSYTKEGQTYYFVKDNGVGLNDEQMKTLFTPFKRYHSKFEGNGLGLAIVKRIVDKHGGNIFAESDTDKGLTLHFSLTPA
ncbi:MAG: ATP-binding protein [Sediminibacterium sp.]